MKAVAIENIESPSTLAEQFGDAVCGTLDPKYRSSMGQFLTPRRTAAFLAQMCEETTGHLRLLDAGAGVGSLSAAFVEEVLSRTRRPESIQITAWEMEKSFTPSLESVLEKCVEIAATVGVPVTYSICQGDFLRDAVHLLNSENSLEASSKVERFTHALLNPPYRKINVDSSSRLLLRRAGLETSNLYTGFLWLSALLLSERGQMVTINPRSFCNGPYFLTFRKRFFSEMTLDRVHVFNQRDKVFSKDDVLQENVILSARCRFAIDEFVSLSNSDGECQNSSQMRKVKRSDILNPLDPSQIVHLALNDNDDSVKQRMAEMPVALEELGLKVSTGRVVDFRARSFLRDNPERGTVPLIYPAHFNGGSIHWPRLGAKKPNALVASDETADLLVSNGVYVLVKRFTSKEERKRIVATVFKPEGTLARFDSVGFENHLNYFYGRRSAMDEKVARGLAIYLNSTFVDGYFRQFSGHTQVNATDLRNLRYPTLEQLRRLSEMISKQDVDQQLIDESIEATL